MIQFSKKGTGANVSKTLIILIVLLPFVLRPDAVHSSSAGDTVPHYTYYFPSVFGPPSHVFIPAGTFYMGCDPAHNGGFMCVGDEMPLHLVYLDAYYIDRTEVTTAQYAACVAGGPCTKPSDFSSNTRDNYYGNPLFADYPVIYVNWNQAQTYCQWAGGSLPTEAQWEKAARGVNDTRPYPWGDESPTCDRVNAKVQDVICVKDTTEVGSHSPQGDSPYGVQDMVGNVYEFLNDWYSWNYYQVSPDSNPTGPLTGTRKVRRAGGFGSWGNILRVVARVPTDPALSVNYIGIRCVYPP
jgi:formylglycine-generating enzyme required for sulfatase activity